MKKIFLVFLFLSTFTLNATQIETSCDVFLFDNVEKNSVFEQINNVQMREVNELKTFISSKKAPKDWVSTIKATGKVYRNDGKIFSSWNTILYEYYDMFPKAGISEHTINLAILPNGKVKEIKISDLFEPNKNWQTPLLLKGIELLQKQGFEFWDKTPDSIIKDIKSGKSDFNYYFYSFVITDKNSIIIIFQSLSLAPNSEGYPSVEIPIKDLKFYKGI